jgi:hypothetical protein
MLTPRFLKHLFQETLTFTAAAAASSSSSSSFGLGTEMDFRGFLDFAMAMQLSSETAALKYYW